MNPPALAITILVALALPAHAFKLQALGPAEVPPSDPQARGFLALFTSDVHERITRRAYEKAGVVLQRDVIAGVRWNDNPPAIRLGVLFGGCDRIGCLASMLRVDRMAWEVVTRREKGIPPLRSHFGDMQFLHAMAAGSGESARETRDKAMRWSEFAYRVARGDIAGRANVHGLGGWIGGLFNAPEKRLWSVYDVFLPKDADLRLVAFGTLLHLVEDSYSAAHVLRVASRTQRNGCASYDGRDAIVEFHTYNGQDTEKHAVCDDPPDWLEEPREGSPVEVIARIVRAYADGADWPVVKEILEQDVFRLAPDPGRSSPGREFEWKEPADASR